MCSLGEDMASHELGLTRINQKSGEIEFLPAQRCSDEFGFVMVEDIVVGPKLAQAADRIVKSLSFFRMPNYVVTHDGRALLESLASAPQLALRHYDQTIGWGVVALEAIPIGRAVVEYLGAVTFQHPRLFVGDTTYVMEYPLPGLLNFKWLIDARRYGNISRFINHEREPNTVIEVVCDGRCPRLLFVAKQRIEQGEQITLNYGDDYWQQRRERELSYSN